jgi:hypothetical protein
MRWFKHLTDASDDDFLKLLEHSFGWEGYGRWWKLCEIVGKNIKKHDQVASRSLPWPEWQTKLKAKRNQLRCFLECLANQGRISLKETDDILEITLPKLLKYRDEYSKKSGHAPDENPDKVGVQNTEDRIQKTKNKKESKPLPTQASAKEQVESLTVDTELREYARKFGQNADALIEDWRDYFRGTGYRTGRVMVSDARATFRRWIRNARTSQPAKGSLFNQQPRRVEMRDEE